jgi:predicted DsbA family dithiol-disulfide isomerase
LEQVNSAEGPDWKLWEQPDSHRSRGRVAFQAAVAARLQGEDAFDRFHFGLLRAKHEEGQDHGHPATLRAVAEAAGLDLDRFERDRTDRAHLPRIGEDYTEGRERHGVFGTPTFVFSNGGAAYLKLRPAPPPDDALPLFQEFVRSVRDRPNLIEIKRPVKPS